MECSRFLATPTGNDNIGQRFVNALYNNTYNNNTAIGVSALFANTSGFQNTANGFQALQNNTDGFWKYGNRCLQPALT